MLFVLLVLLLCLPPPACRALNYLYCSFSDNCDCDFRPNVKAELEWDLYKNVYGQHLAQDIISEEVVRFLQNKSPEKPLVLSFHGSSGTGKTLVSSMLGSHLYGSAMSSPYVHRFIPALHFPSAGQVDQYRVQLKNWVQGNLTACARSVFIFDEMERMPRGLVDVLEPFLGPSHVVFGTNYRKALYVFIRRGRGQQSGPGTPPGGTRPRGDHVVRPAGRHRSGRLRQQLQRPLPVVHHPAEAHHVLRALPAAEPLPRGALCALAALPARRLPAQ
ncbi:prosalusin isoform X4 [Nerophis ophidion]|uniref:prosalusin isoform X4 n=1 Tax=Nerophis ophidion TaxID=159077 RepID=UPI002AE0733E|nr:prosalusin isoform X4 [Nerophis ophidion]